MPLYCIQKSVPCKVSFRRLMLIFSLMSFSIFPSPAQSLSDGLNAFSSATAGILPYIDSVRGLCYALAACMSIVGACGVYWQIISETGNVKKPIVSSVAACLMFISLGTALPSFFGISVSSGSSDSEATGTYIDNNGRFRYDDWYAESAPTSGWEIMNGGECIAPAYRNNFWDN